MPPSFAPPSYAQFQAQFPRDFPYGSGPETVTANDFQNAVNEGQQLFNPALWNTSIPQFSATYTGDTQADSETITELSSTYGLLPGQTVSGSGIPSGATLALIGSGSVQLSVAATITAEDVALTFGGASGYSMSEATLAYLYLTAHLLVLSLQNAGGLSAVPLYAGQQSSGGGVISSKGVGGVNVGYDMSDPASASMVLNQFKRTGYGQKYLQMLAPKLAGRRVMVVGGEPSIAAPPNLPIGQVPPAP